MKLTDAQKKALAALFVLHESGTTSFRLLRKRGGQNTEYRAFRRWEIANVAKGNCSSYPLKTMQTLRGHGLVAPLHEDAVELVELNICRCGCDLWYITDAGRKLAETWNIKGSRPNTPRPTGEFNPHDFFGGGEHPQDGWWKDGDGPPPFDPNGPSQTHVPGDSD